MRLSINWMGSIMCIMEGSRHLSKIVVTAYQAYQGLTDVLNNFLLINKITNMVKEIGHEMSLKSNQLFFDFWWYNLILWVYVHMNYKAFNTDRQKIFCFWNHTNYFLYFFMCTTNTLNLSNQIFTASVFPHLLKVVWWQFLGKCVSNFFMDFMKVH